MWSDTGSGINPQLIWHSKSFSSLREAALPETRQDELKQYAELHSADACGSVRCTVDITRSVMLALEQTVGYY